jgi:CO dehydrogenase nickel-insertion accessory protein CooC1
MSTIDVLFQAVTKQVDNSYPSIYTKSDVVKLLIDLQSKLEAITTKTDDEQSIPLSVIKEILENLPFENYVNVNEDDIDLSISGREIYIEDINPRIDEEDIVSDIIHECKCHLNNKK